MIRFLSLLRQEARAVLTDPVIMLTVVGGVVFYSFLYPLPYSGQVPREQPVGVVDLDGSALSRKLVRWIYATPEVRVAARPASLAGAEELVNRHELAGFVVVPENFHRDLLLGRPVHLAVAGDATFFLVHGAVARGAAAAAGTLGAEIKVGRLLASGQEIRLAARRWTPFGLNAKPVFNTTLGYINYVVPAVFILILQQTLLIGLGVLGGTQNAARRAGGGGYWLEHPAWRVLAARTLVFLGIYTVLSLYYLGFCFEHHGVPRHAAPGDLLRLALPFLLAVIGLGTVLGQLLARRDLATQIVLFSSLPLVFTSGFVWPAHLVPAPLLALAALVPSTPAIQAFLRINQMGAEFAQVAPLWSQLWLQAVVYGLLAWWLVHRNARAARRPGRETFSPFSR